MVDRAGSALVPAVIGAVGAVIAAVLSAAAAYRAQRRAELLEKIEDLFQRYSDQDLDDFKNELRQILDARTRGLYINEIVKRGMRDVMREEADEKRKMVKTGVKEGLREEAGEDLLQRRRWWNRRWLRGGRGKF